MICRSSVGQLEEDFDWKRNSCLLPGGSDEGCVVKQYPVNIVSVSVKWERCRWSACATKAHKQPILSRFNLPHTQKPFSLFQGFADSDGPIDLSAQNNHHHPSCFSPHPKKKSGRLPCLDVSLALPNPRRCIINDADQRNNQMKLGAVCCRYIRSYRVLAVTVMLHRW